jgi:uncharacterized protein YndB with AHSA1/START domain
MTIVHETITLERRYDARPERVFQAFSDGEAKALWFHRRDYWPIRVESTFDFREGGLETNTSGPSSDELYRYTARYHDIVPNRRILLSYEMSRSGERISVSLQSIELFGEDGGTRLVLIDHGAYLDGLDRPHHRRGGIQRQLDQLAKALTVD